MSLTVAIPTIGRPSLARCVFSFIDQLENGDSVLLVADPKGDTDYVKWVYGVATNKLGVNWRYVIKGGEGGWGQAQRNYAYDLVEDGHIWCLSDDDIATPNALAEIRGVLQANTWYLFQAGRATDDPWVWQDRRVRVGNLDADCIVAPTRARSRRSVESAPVKARWGLDYEGDHKFACALELELGPAIFVRHVIAVTKPSTDYLAQHYSNVSGSILWTAIGDRPMTAPPQSGPYH